MIRNYQVQKEQPNQRMSQKTLDGAFLNLIENGENCPPFVSNAILGVVKNVYHRPGTFTIHSKARQMKVIRLAKGEPSGKPFSNCRKKECTITIYSDSEDAYIMAAYGVTGLRCAKPLFNTQPH